MILLDFCLARGTPFSLVCFAEKSFKSFKIVHYLFILFGRFVRFGRFLPRKRHSLNFISDAKVQRKFEPTKR